MPLKCPKSSNTLKVDSNEKLNNLADMLNDLNSPQKKIVLSLNSCRESIKAQDKKYTSFESKLSSIDSY